jgi:predicted nucleic acid-binding protein
LEVAVGSRDPALAWATLRDAYTVVSFTDELAEATTGIASALRREGTAVAYQEVLVSEDRKAFREFPGLRLRTYRRGPGTPRGSSSKGAPPPPP